MATATSSKPSAPAAPKTKGTTYVVLGEDSNGKFTRLSSLTAGNDRLAIRNVHKELGENDHYVGFVAIPERSFQIRKVSTSTVVHTTVS